MESLRTLGARVNSRETLAQTADFIERLVGDAWLPGSCRSLGSLLSGSVVQSVFFSNQRHDPAFETRWPICCFDSRATLCLHRATRLLSNRPSTRDNNDTRALVV